MSPSATARFAIHSIIFRRSCAEVIRVHACWIVARMQYVHSFRNRTIEQLVTHAMSFLVLVVEIEQSVTAAVLRFRNPDPASALGKTTPIEQRRLEQI